MSANARAMRDALDQTEAGIPLNWTQVADDPELLTLASLQRAASEWREERAQHVPPELRDDLRNTLAATLPKPKPKPVRPEPKPLAGFSSAVPVLTQAEEDVPTITPNTLPWIAFTLAAALVVGIVMQLLGSVFRNPEPTFRWIEVRQGGTVLLAPSHPAGWTLPACRAFNPGDPSMTRSFSVSVPDRGRAGIKVGFPVTFLPPAVTSTNGYNFRLLDVGISPCTGDTADPTDSGAAVKLGYSARAYLTPGLSGTSSASPLVIFQSRAMPAYMDVTSGSWKRVNTGAGRGIYWTGAPYTDMENTKWIGKVSVLMVESGDIVTTYVGQSDQGITADLLLALAGGSGAAGNKPLPLFTWIDLKTAGGLVRGSLSAAFKGEPCTVAGPPNAGVERTFARVATMPQTQAYVGYPLFALPVSGTIPITFTTKLIEGEVRPCAGDQLISGDPGAAAKLRYSIRQGEGNAARAGEVTLFQTRHLPSIIDISKGRWKEVITPALHGIVWTGTPYHDIEGSDWSHTVNVLMVEQGDYALTLIGRTDQDITPDLLIALATRASQ